MTGDGPLPGPQPQFFFAPGEMAGPGPELGQRYAAAWEAFAPVVRRTMRIEHVMDGEGLVRVYRDLLAGTTDPAAGFVVSLHPQKI